MIEGWQYHPDAPVWDKPYTDEELIEMEDNQAEEIYQINKEEKTNEKT